MEVLLYVYIVLELGEHLPPNLQILAHYLMKIQRPKILK